MTDRLIRPRHFLTRALALALLGGCASMQSTPRQAYVWDMGHNCEHLNSDWQLVRVDAEGRYWIRGNNATSSANFQQCMQEQYQQHPYKQWLATNGPPEQTQKPAQMTRQPASPSTTIASVSRTTAESLPVWKPGDEWQSRWESAQGKGTFVWAVDREELVDGVLFYVVKSGTTREIYYRKSDFAYYMDKVSGQIETRHTPPTAFFTWPLTAGAKTEVRYTREQPLDRQTAEMVLTCETGPAETVTLQAGTFQAVKVACRDSRTNAPNFEVWLSPATKHIVRERTYFSYGVRERELIGLKLR